MTETNIPDGLYKAIEKVMDEHSAWIARPDRPATEAVCCVAMEYFGERSKRQQMHMVMDGAIEALKAIRR